MSNELSDALRGIAEEIGGRPEECLLVEAADEIERLRDQLAEDDATIDAFGKVSPQQYEKEIADLRAQLAIARKGLEKIAGLIDSESGEPLDDAIEIAKAALTS